MLPPVQAALSSNIDFQSQPQVVANRARVEVSASALQSDAEKANGLSSARSDALSLSAQLKLAQGSSIFAETIGKLLKTPRRENETLIDYTTRLFDAVQALKPAEVANVERLLNQIVKGISLRILAEVLREPAGPAAARLAVYIETASIAERDLAANAVVSSYRQNASTDPAQAGYGMRVPVNGNAPAAANTAASPSPQPANANNGAQVDHPSAPMANPVAGKNGEAQTTQGSNLQSATVATGPDRATTAPQKAAETSQTPVSTPTGSNPSAEQSSGADTTSDPAATNAKASQPQPGAASTAASQTGSPQAAVPQVATANGLLPTAAAAVAADANIAQQAIATGNEPDAQVAAKLQEAAAFLETSDGQDGDGMPVPARLWTSLSDQAVAKLASWAAAIADNPEPPAAVQAAAQVVTAAEDGVDPQQTGGIAQAKTAAPAATQQPISSAATPASEATDPVDTLRTGAIPTAPRETAEQALAAASATVQAPAREAPPWPYVAAYPPGEDEPRRQGRKTPPVLAIEDEEPDGSSEQYGAEDEQDEGEETQDETPDEAVAGDAMTAAEKAAGYIASDASVDGGIAETRPSDLYWHMAGWN